MLESYGHVIHLGECGRRNVGLAKTTLARRYSELSWKVGIFTVHIISAYHKHNKPYILFTCHPRLSQIRLFALLTMLGYIHVMLNTHNPTPTRA